MTRFINKKRTNKSRKELTRRYTGIRHVLEERRQIKEAQTLMKKHVDFHEKSLQHTNVLDCACDVAKKVRRVLRNNGIEADEKAVDPNVRICAACGRSNCDCNWSG